MRRKDPESRRDSHERNDRIGIGKELKSTVMARFKARSKGRMEWSTIMESM